MAVWPVPLGFASIGVVISCATGAAFNIWIVTVAGVGSTAPLLSVAVYVKVEYPT